MFLICSSFYYQVKALFSPLVWARLVQLAKKYLNPQKVPEKESVKIDVTEKSKEERTKIHNTVKSTFKHMVFFNEHFRTVITVIIMTTLTEDACGSCLFLFKTFKVFSTFILRCHKLRTEKTTKPGKSSSSSST